MSLTYTTYQASIANLMAVNASSPGFVTMLPNMIDDAEQRIQRDLDFLQTRVRDTSGALTTGVRRFSLPVTPTTTYAGTFFVTEDINVITPAGTSNPDLGTRNPLMPTSKEMLDFTWPSTNGSTVPKYFSFISQGLIIVGPWPDQAYKVEVVGTQRFQPISASNTTTFISTYLPDLFVAASMVFASGYMKNYGNMRADDPQQPVSWESHYAILLKSAMIEEARKKFTGQGWSSMQPSPIVTPPRT